MGLEIKSLQEKWNKMSTGAKAATVVGTVAVAGGVAATTAAAIRGGKLNKINKDLFEISSETGKIVKKEGAEQPKLFATLKEGFKSIFTKEGRKAWTGVEAKEGQEAIKGQKDLFKELKEESKKLMDEIKEKAGKKADEAATRTPAPAPAPEASEA